MSSRLDKKKYQFIKLWDRLGIRLKKILLLLFLFTITVQSIIAFDIDFLPQSTTMELEGKAVIESYHYESRGQIKITAENKEDMSLIKIYINGELNEIRNNDSILLNIRNNDVIEIDGVGNKKYINVIIEKASENLIFPKESMRYRIHDNIVALGRMKLK